MNAAALAFEVMDKEFPLWLIVAAASLGGVVGFFLGRWRWWAATLLLPLLTLLAWLQFVEITDPYVGPAIRHEAGAVYVAVSWLAMGFIVLFPMVGAALGYHKRRVANG